MDVAERTFKFLSPAVLLAPPLSDLELAKALLDSSRNSSPSAVGSRLFGNPHQGQGGGVHVEDVGVVHLVADEDRMGPGEVGFSLHDEGLIRFSQLTFVVVVWRLRLNR